MSRWYSCATKEELLACVLNDLNKAYEKTKNNIIKSAKDNFKQLVYETRSIHEKYIDMFYSDYDQHSRYYERNYDLYNTLEMEVDEKNLSIYRDIGFEYMKYEHRETNEYIFNITLHNGWHGGAIPGDDYAGHIALNGDIIEGGGNIPYWRAPIIIDNKIAYWDWYKPAKIMNFEEYGIEDNIESQILLEWDASVDNIQANLDNETCGFVYWYIDEIKKIIEKIGKWMNTNRKRR